MAFRFIFEKKRVKKKRETDENQREGKKDIKECGHKKEGERAGGREGEGEEREGEREGGGQRGGGGGGEGREEDKGI